MWMDSESHNESSGRPEGTVFGLQEIFTLYFSNNGLIKTPGSCANRRCEHFALMSSWHAGLAPCRV